MTELNINNLVVVFDQTAGDDNCEEEGDYQISISRRYLHGYGHSVFSRAAVGGGCGGNIENHVQPRYLLSFSPPLSA